MITFCTSMHTIDHSEQNASISYFILQDMRRSIFRSVTYVLSCCSSSTVNKVNDGPCHASVKYTGLLPNALTIRVRGHLYVVASSLGPMIIGASDQYPPFNSTGQNTRTPLLKVTHSNTMHGVQRHAKWFTLSQPCHSHRRQVHAALGYTMVIGLVRGYDLYCSQLDGGLTIMLIKTTIFL